LANHKSAAKRARQTPRREAVNNAHKSAVRTYERKLRKAISDKDVQAAGDLLKQFASQIMRATKRRIYSKNAVARKLSRLSSAIHSLQK
jgi:small subunit ribosomal protein S20